MHATGFFVAEKYPGEHGEQKPRALANVPAAHEVQLEDPGGAMEPGGHAAQMLPPLDTLARVFGRVFVLFCHVVTLVDNPVMTNDALEAPKIAGAISNTVSPLSFEVFVVEVGRLYTKIVEIRALAANVISTHGTSPLLHALFQNVVLSPSLMLETGYPV